MPRFQVELTVSIGGTVFLDAETIEEARRKADRIDAWAVDVSLSNGDYFDGSLGSTFVTIEGVSQPDDEDVAPPVQAKPPDGGAPANK